MGKVHETSFGNVRHGIIPETLLCSNDAKRVAYVIQSGATSYGIVKNVAGMKYYVVIDGKSDIKEVNCVSPGSLKFSSDSQRFGYVAQIDNLFHVFIDNDISDGHAAIGKDSPIFSPNSLRVAYAVAVEKGKTFYVIDGVSGQQFTAVAGIVFSPDSKRTGYIASLANDQHIVVIDNSHGQLYRGLQLPGIVFSPDSQRFAYGAYKGARNVMVVDGNEGPEYENIGSPVFSPNSRHFAYTAKKDNKWYVCIDGNIGDGYEAVGSAGVSFRSDSIPAYIMLKEAGSFESKKWFIVTGDKISPAGYDGIGIGSPVFSPDSMRTAFAAQRGDKWFVAVDGQSGPEAAGVRDPIFSPDSRHYAYHITTSAGQMCVIRDGKQGVLYDGVGGTALLFSPDSQHLAYSSTKNDQSFIVIDGEEYGPYDGFVTKSNFVFEGNRLRALALRGYEIIKIEIEF